MIREQEKIRKANVYQALKAKMVNKPYFTKTTEIFKEVASIYGYEARSVSNIYYDMRKKEEKALCKIRLPTNKSQDVAQWFKEFAGEEFELKVQSDSDTELKKDFTINLFPKEGEFSFDFWVEVEYTTERMGKGITEPVDVRTTINSYTVELTCAYNEEGEELILKQKHIQEIEKHLYSILNIQIL